MKKLIALLLAFTLVLVGCGNLDDKLTVTGFIKEIHDDHILIATSTAEGLPYGASFDVSVNMKDCGTIYDSMAVGDEIVVCYDGNMSGFSPARIDSVNSITLKTKADDFDPGTGLAARYPHFVAKVLEIQDNSLFVKPAVGTEELESADKFAVPLTDVDNATELQAGDYVLIIYDGKILETYPAKLGAVYSVGKLALNINDVLGIQSDT